MDTRKLKRDWRVLKKMYGKYCKIIEASEGLGEGLGEASFEASEVNSNEASKRKGELEATPLTQNEAVGASQKNFEALNKEAEEDKKEAK